MNIYDIVCFSPPGPGQCQEHAPTQGHGEHQKPHDVPEPSIFLLLLVAMAAAMLVSRRV